MRIAWVNPSFLDYRIPLYETLNTLSKGNFHLIYSKNRVPQRCIDKIEKAIGKNALGLTTERIIKIGKNSDFANSSISLPFPKGLYRLIKSVDADIIIAEGFFQFTPWALFYTLMNRKPLIIAYERTAHTERNCPKWRKLYRKAINYCTSGYMVNGSLTKEYLMSQGVSPDLIFTGGMCADSSELALKHQSISVSEKETLRKRLDMNKKGIGYIYVGQLIERKGVGFLLNSWREHIANYPNDKLLIVGDGPLRQQLMTEHSSNTGVIFIGSVDYAEIHKYYAMADVFVIPTLEDNWSLVVPEAMSCGLPIACSIYNGCYPELVHEGKNGTLFNPLDNNSVIKALSHFHFADLNKYGQESIKIEECYNPQKTAENIINAVNATMQYRKRKQ